MGLRRGFLVGFLAGSAAGSVLSQESASEAPADAEPPRRGMQPKAIAARLRERLGEAVAAGKAAQAEKERELSRRFDAMKESGN